MYLLYLFKMRKILIINLLFITCLVIGFAQHSKVFTNADAQFIKGKELFAQAKFAASYPCFVDFLKNADIEQVSQLEEAEFYLAANAYELQQKNATNLLKGLLTKYPNTVFADEVNYRLGRMEVDTKNFELAMQYFNQVNTTHLGQHSQTECLFSKGYAAIQTKSYSVASDIYKNLKEVDTPYKFSSAYYFAYSEYCQKNYAAALPQFLKLEDNPQYKSIVAYYIVQIYYAQKDYDKLNDRADILLKNSPDNKNNAEIYRIAGEIAYRKQNYDKAINYLKSYEKLFPQVLRNDMYLLGLSYFQTKDYNNAVLYLSKATSEKDEMTENAYMHLGNSYLKLKDFANAKLAFEASLSSNFNKSVREEAMFNYALTCYESTTAFGESISAFEQFLNEFPNSKHAEKAFDYLSTVYLTTKNYEVAYQSVQKIKSASASFLETKQYILYQLGTEAFVQNNFEKAINRFTLALEFAPAGKYSAECLYWRAESKYRINQPEQAIGDLKTFFSNSNLKSSANQVMANYLMAYSYFSKKNYSESLNWFLKYIDAETNMKATSYPDAMNRIGDCYFNNRNFAKAQLFYSKSASASPASADYSLFQAAYVTGLQKNYESKITKLESLISQFPTSGYVDNALYEIGRAWLLLENNAKAIATYQRLLEQKPSADLACKAALEIGMIYFNDKNYDKSIAAYKNVITNYPGTEEANTALESLQTAYIESNEVSNYMAYIKTLGMGTKSGTEDSISYIAAEHQYMNANYSKAISGLQTYLNQFGQDARYAGMAQYYLAESYYVTEDKVNALKAYQEVLKITGNQFTEEAALRCSEITYDRKDFASAMTYFKQLETVAHSVDNKNISRLGVLRCSFFLNDYQTTVKIAAEIAADPHSGEEMKAEAIYNRSKAYLALNQFAEAIIDLKTLSTDTRTATGAEANYLLANLYFDQGKMTDVEQTVMEFAKKNTPHQFWLARSFVLLADMYIKLNKDFQAKQYLLSLQKNYKPVDEIQKLITERLNAISERDKKSIIN